MEAYDMTIKVGKTTICFVAPSSVTDSEIERILDEFHFAGWAILEEIQEKEESKIL
ncbi:hypothetical protein [Aneurinibacillus uraniidurans]|uniref:hypothetical protein n=1 Tax=Aneurinibacillus uraniidurans TaxID=2966586 RepID=UPI00234B4D68|nr:hypothetical protein [Aneurinibacillus sp. B1]WCN38663.1 hypothetical protein PO771_04475 [Aneurinibacillus sp. B1]